MDIKSFLKKALFWTLAVLYVDVLVIICVILMPFIILGETDDFIEHLENDEFYLKPIIKLRGRLF